MSSNQTGVKYPECTVELTGMNGNAVLVFRKVRKELIRHLVDVKGWDRQDAESEGNAFQEEAISGDYDNVIATCLRWVNVI